MSQGSDLANRLVQPAATLEEFQSVATDAIAYMSNSAHSVSSPTSPLRQHYELWTVTPGNRKFAIRPVNADLYVGDPSQFETLCSAVFALLHDLAKNRGATRTLTKKHRGTIEGGAVERVFYTIQQSYGMASDVLLDANTARKHVGLKFEALVGAAFKALGIAHKHLSFKVPGEEGDKPYSAEIDFVIGGDREIASHSSQLAPGEVLVSVKSSSKDRMPKIFIDRLLMEKITGRAVRLIGVFHNDVQRKGRSDTSVTFVANLFLIYSKHLGPLDGVYFVDPPPHIERAAWRPYVKRFQELLLTDVWSLFET